MWIRDSIIILLTIIVLDAVMLGLIVRTQWSTAVQKIQHSPLQPRLQYGILTYLLLTIGVLVFVLPRVHSARDCIVWGGLFGLVVYGVFDTTNLVILKDYPLSLAAVDTIWGAVLIAMACLATGKFSRN